jgi:NitT/TauT family transport system ATP-binding protein
LRVNLYAVSKTFQTRNKTISVLENITLSTIEQEFLCILGPSGCGKTTLLRILAGLLKPTSGRVVYEGKTRGDIPPISMVFQEKGIFPWLNVMDNACFGLEMQGVPVHERYQIALPLLVKLGLGGFTKHYPHQLSVGMNQRVALARALISRADILLMDEPFAALDAQMRLISQEKLLEVCTEYRKSVIYVTHDIDEALLLADRIILLTAGPAKIKEEVAVDLAHPRNIDSENGADFIRMKQKIWKHIREEVEKGPQR